MRHAAAHALQHGKPYLSTLTAMEIARGYEQELSPAKPITVTVGRSNFLRRLTSRNIHARTARSSFSRPRKSKNTSSITPHGLKQAQARSHDRDQRVRILRKRTFS